MANLLFLDAAYPPARYPGGINGVAFYLGGDTPHAWTSAEISACPYRYRLPIWVRSNPPGPGAAADVSACVARLKSLGAPPGTLVAWDMETAVDASYITSVYNALKAAGYKLIVYGSQSSVLGNKNPDGMYWGAQWTGAVHLASSDVMTQYVSYAAYDESDAEATLPFWDTKGPAPAAAPWPLSSGSTGQSVVILQRGLNKWRTEIGLKTVLVTDGSFGKLTLDAVKLALQYWHYNAARVASGVVDESLWNHLWANPPATPPPAPPPPWKYEAPANLTEVTPVTRSVTFSWSPPPGTVPAVAGGVPAAAGYTVQVATAAGTVVKKVSVTGLTATVSGLAAGSYTASVWANGGEAPALHAVKTITV